MLIIKQLNCIYSIYKGYYDFIDLMIEHQVEDFIDLMIEHQVEWAGTDFSLAEAEKQLSLINERLFPFDKEPFHWVKDLDFEKFAYNYRLNHNKKIKLRTNE